eukprot:snap_masked-scaffold_14-processed-gene-10.52-mRNA-1 protein AED:1.00 eAED:1.00 QI:0/-1/0/0/-1/1/1/0/132
MRIKKPDVKLDEFLKLQGGPECLKAHLIEEFAVENFLFYQKLLAIKEMKVRTAPENNIFIQEKILINEFLLLTSNMQVNISMQAKLKLVKQIEQHSLALDTVEDVLVEVLDFISNDSFPRFLVSSKYKVFVS